ncbi:metal transporter Nramp2 [Panicum miliaceum]|uniref:Metal transporter Nramp2 n=1 Tax=Panicum miliaceum TaxID=4540 RepID=A0A3L6TSU5_PANMI|nr:metal transporter Nramp2 [Panicum miliaceum]
MASRDLAESLLPGGGGDSAAAAASDSHDEYEERAYDSDDKVPISISDSDAEADGGGAPSRPPFSWRKLWRFTGPGFLMCIAFLDPGNLEGDLQAGAAAGYQLLWLLLWATVMGALIQLLSARLGVATGKHLAELCREEYPPWATRALWAMTELALVGADIQEVIGSAIAIKILSGGTVPLWGGVVITALDCFIFLFLENYGVRKLEAFFAVLIATMALSFAVMFGETKPSGKELLIGLVVPKLSSKTIKQAVGIVGCIIMPHNVFLHSALVQSRKIDTNKKSRVQEAVYYYNIESILALIVSFFINICVTTVFAKGFYGTEQAEDPTMDVLNEALNVLQSIQIPFALIPLITLVSKEQVMGSFVVGPITKVISWIVTVFLMLINGYLIVSFYITDIRGAVLRSSLCVVLVVYLAFIIYLIVWNTSMYSRLCSSMPKRS